MLDVEVVEITSDSIKQELVYPHIRLFNIKIKQQLERFINRKSVEGVLKVKVYGAKDNKLVDLGVIDLTASMVARLNFLGITVIYYESEDLYSNLLEVNNLCKLCTSKFLRTL